MFKWLNTSQNNEGCLLEWKVYHESTVSKKLITINFIVWFFKERQVVYLEFISLEDLTFIYKTLSETLLDTEMVVAPMSLIHSLRSLSYGILVTYRFYRIVCICSSPKKFLSRTWSMIEATAMTYFSVLAGILSDPANFPHFIRWPSWLLRSMVEWHL